VTLGFFLLVINAAMLALVAALLPGLHIAGFGAALLGALIVSITGWIGSFFRGFTRTRGVSTRTASSRTRPRRRYACARVPDFPTQRIQKVSESREQHESRRAAETATPPAAQIHHHGA